MEVQVTVRGLDGSVILGPKALPCEGLVARVSEELLSSRPLRPRQTVLLIQGTNVLQDDAPAAAEAVALVATFAPAFGEERRQQCLATLGAAGLRRSEHLTAFARGLSEDACDDAELMAAVLGKAGRIGGRSLEYALMGHASAALRDDARFVRSVVSRNGHLLFHASARLRGSRDIVRAAVGSANSAFVYAGDGLRGDVNFVHEMAKLAPSVLPFASAEMRATVKRLLARDTSTSGGSHEVRSPAWDLALRLIVRDFKKVSLVAPSPTPSKCRATNSGSQEMQGDGLQSLTLRMIARYFEKVSLAAPSKCSATNSGSQEMQGDGLQSLTLRMIARYFNKVSSAAPSKCSATNGESQEMQGDGLQSLTLRMIARYFNKVSSAAPSECSATNGDSHEMHGNGPHSLTLRMIARYFKKVSSAAPSKCSATAGVPGRMPAAAGRCDSPRVSSAGAHALRLIVRCVERRHE